MYADEYIPIGNGNSNVYLLKKSITDLKNWMTTNKLKLNGEDIEVIILSDKSRKFSIDLNNLNCACKKIPIPSANVVRNYSTTLGGGGGGGVISI